MKQQWTITIPKAQERSYFTVPFQVPQGIERLEITYRYPREHADMDEGGITRTTEENIIDLALQMPGETFVGTSGSDRQHIWISATDSCPGYRRTAIAAGEWQLIFGAYRVVPQGVTVEIETEMRMKTLRRFQGDTHMHTTASDGKLSTEALAVLARQQQLDFIFITNHNNYFCNEHLPEMADLTIMPGMEWTHYRGHANLLGVNKPMGNPFCVNDAAQAQQKLQEGKDAGAMLVINHPFCAPECGWKWGFDLIPFDALEVWNGPLMVDYNAECLHWWHSQLCASRRIPVLGGSDFHKTGFGTLPGLPTTVVYAPSREPEDLLAALRAGHSYIKLSPDAPDIALQFDEGMLGDVAPMAAPVQVTFTGLRGGDILCRCTDTGMQQQEMPPQTTRYQQTWQPEAARFVRYEVKRAILGLQTVLVSNPIYFGEEWYS